MIRIGCCTNMLADAVDRAGLSYIFKAAQAGFAYVEPPLAEFMNLEEETLLQVERLLKNDKIRVDAFCNLFPASLRLTGPEADLKKADGYMEPVSYTHLNWLYSGFERYYGCNGRGFGGRC